MMTIKTTKSCFIAFILIVGVVYSVFCNAPLFAAQEDRNEQLARNHYQRALKYDFSGDHEHAIEEYKKALELHPEPLMSATGKELIRTGLADALRGAHRYDEAIDVLKEAIKLSSNQPHLYFSLAGVYTSKGDFENAENTYISIRELNPKFDPEYYLANLYEKKGDLEGAIGFFKKYLALHPESFDIYKELSSALLKVHRNNEAADALEQYLQGYMKKYADVSPQEKRYKEIQEEIERTKESIQSLRGIRRAIPNG